MAAMLERSPESSNAAVPSAGTVIDGKWELEAVLGRGAMGVVIGARHRVLGQKVAIKFLSKAGDEVARERFFREAKIIASLRSEHVVRVIDVGTTRIDRDDVQFIVMERLEGETVSSHLARSGPLPPDEAAEIVYQACLAMSEAHALDVVHRDLKPGNLFLSRRDDGSLLIRVLDFGVSKLGGKEDTELTTTTTLIGSPAYMAPEQVKSAKYVDARTDLWALGVILHRLLSGSLPFSGESAMEMCASILSEEPASLDVAVVPAGLVGVVRRALKKSPAARFHTAREMAEALAPFAGRPTRHSGPIEVASFEEDPTSTPDHASMTAEVGRSLPRAGTLDVREPGSTTNIDRGPPSMTHAVAISEGSLAESVSPVQMPRRRGAWAVIGVLALLTFGGLGLYARMRSEAVPEVVTSARETPSTQPRPTTIATSSTTSSVMPSSDVISDGAEAAADSTVAPVTSKVAQPMPSTKTKPLKKPYIPGPSPKPTTAKSGAPPLSSLGKLLDDH